MSGSMARDVLQVVLRGVSFVNISTVSWKGGFVTVFLRYSIASVSIVFVVFSSLFFQCVSSIVMVGSVVTLVISGLLSLHLL